MRAISFALTTPQFLDGSKTVTRRVGWATLKVWDRLVVVRKLMGLKRGEHREELGLIRVRSVRRELLCRLTHDVSYGRKELVREGFPEWTPPQFVEFFCRTHRGCTPDSLVTRIEFERLVCEHAGRASAGIATRSDSA